MGCCSDESTGIFAALRGIFCAAAVVCLLCAAHRIARGLLLSGEVAALAKLDEAYTPEEREQLIHRIKVHSLRL